MRLRIYLGVVVLVLASQVSAGRLGERNGPEPANIGQIADVLRQDPYDMELLISFGTSKGGSAGHIALAIRTSTGGDDETVYSANFYADRASAHAAGFYNDELMIAVPKEEYLFKTRSSLADTASFGLDFGEIYKRSIVGVRVYGVPPGEKEALTTFFKRINDDYHNHVARPNTTITRSCTVISISTARKRLAPHSSMVLDTRIWKQSAGPSRHDGRSRPR